MNYLKLTKDKLSVDCISDLVVSPKCGAISIFVGTTRDNFENKTVIKLEYEAYESMGIKAMESICSEIRSQWKSVENIAIYHRLGTVPVKEASIVIAVSSPHREEAIKATEYCINSVKKTVPIWKKEVYADSKPEWKENKELPHPPKCRKPNLDIDQEMQVPYIAPHLIQVKASQKQLNDRIEKFMARKRSEIDINNVKEFCQGPRSSATSCARVDSVLQKRKDSKSHLRVGSVLNTYKNRDQMSSDYLMKYIPPNGIEERVINLETQLSLSSAVPKNIYKRLKQLEDRLLLLESISPEYIQFWDKTSMPIKAVKKKIFSLEEIDQLIADSVRKIKHS